MGGGPPEKVKEKNELLLRHQQSSVKCLTIPVPARL